MAKQSNGTTEATFTLPDTLTVRQQLKFAGQLGRVFEYGGHFTAYWQAGIEFITDWQCDLIPDPTAVNIDTETDPRVTRIIISAANAIADWYLNLGNVEKNS